MVKTLPSNAGYTGSIPGRGAKTPRVLGPKTKTENRSSIVTSSTKTLKMVNIKKNYLKIISFIKRMSFMLT